MANATHPLTAELASALEMPRWDDAIAAVKSVVTAHLEDLHSGARIRHTDFFNHSFAPDLTMDWPDSSAEPRQVFLRFPDQPEYIAVNVAEDVPRGSMVVGLGELAPEGPDGQLQSSSFGNETLVLDPPSLGELGLVGRRGRGSALITSAVAKGGRGLFHDEKVERVVSVVSRGLDGAARGEAVETALAAQAVDSDFGSRQSHVLGHLLQTYWVAGGSRPEDYPGAFRASTRIGTDELQLLLETLDIESWDFWRRLGADVAFTQILELPNDIHTQNLDRLIRSNTDRLVAKVAWVRVEGGTLKAEGAHPFAWHLENKLLRLDGPTFEAHFGAAMQRIEQLSVKAKTIGIAPDVLLARAPGLGITEARFDDGRSQMMFATDDIAQDDRTAAMAASFGDKGRIVKATATVPGAGTHAQVDFQLSTVSAVTSSQPPLAGMATTAVVALVPMDSKERAALDAFLALPEDINGSDASQLPI